MRVTFVIPVYNEEKSLATLAGMIQQQMNSLGADFEILFVDDGSVDSSFQVIKGLREESKNIKVIKFRRNVGKSNALDEAFKLSKGDIVFTMDADLQDDPTEIPRFIEKIDEGFDLVSGWKQKRKDPVFSKNMPSKLFNFMIGAVSGLKLHDYNCGFKAYRKDVVKRLSLYGDLHRYIPALVHAMGFKVTEIPVKHQARPFGKSKYGLERFFHGFFDFVTVVFLTKYLKRPMHFFGWLGSLCSLAGFLVCSYLSFLWLLNEPIGTRPLLILGVLLLLVGVQLFSAGLIAEMITHGRQNKGLDDMVELVLD